MLQSKKRALQEHAGEHDSKKRVHPLHNVMKCMNSSNPLAKITWPALHLCYYLLRLQEIDITEQNFGPAND